MCVGGEQILRVCRLTNLQIDFGPSEMVCTIFGSYPTDLHHGKGLQTLASDQVLMPWFLPSRTGQPWGTNQCGNKGDIEVVGLHIASETILGSPSHLSISLPLHLYMDIIFVSQEEGYVERYTELSKPGFE